MRRKLSAMLLRYCSKSTVKQVCSDMIDFYNNSKEGDPRRTIRKTLKELREFCDPNKLRISDNNYKYTYMSYESLVELHKSLFPLRTPKASMQRYSLRKATKRMYPDKYFSRHFPMRPRSFSASKAVPSRTKYMSPAEKYNNITYPDISATFKIYL